MEAKAEFPDEELASSPIVGGVFRIPTQIEEEGSDSSDYDDRRRTCIRPHSAKGEIGLLFRSLCCHTWKICFDRVVHVRITVSVIKSIYYLSRPAQSGRHIV